ncbi:MAG: hypothetical protein GXP31_12450 [Kiritimatiellaeota bacterium]|nr:hypothetical protein [Kiritimatiellota bacterium]
MPAIQEMEVTVGEVLNCLRINGQFATALRNVVQRKVVRAAAEEAGLSVSDEELQKAADGARAAAGLNKAEDTMAWLKISGLTPEVWEEWLETNLLISKFRDKLEAEADTAAYMAAPAVKETVRELVFQDWLAKAVGGALDGEE